MVQKNAMFSRNHARRQIASNNKISLLLKLNRDVSSVAEIAKATNGKA